MVIDEKGLLALMKDAFRKKSTGYKVACRISEYRVTELVLAGAGWTAVFEREKTPRKVLALIVEHLGDVPMLGQAFQVQDKNTQAEIFDMAVPELPFLQTNKATIARTQVTYMGSRIWQRSDNHKVYMVSEKMENLLANYNLPLSLTDDGKFYTSGAASRVYISPIAAMHNEDTALNHLAKLQWV